MRAFLITLLLSCLTASTAYSNSEQTDPLRLLTIGDSRVEGDRPSYESFRFPLWMNLIDAGYTVDMIGPLEDPSRYPTVQGQAFDPDHAGVGGFETTDILDNLDVIFESDERPDIILIGIGGNDLINSRRTPEQVALNVTNIVSELTDAYPSAHIIVEQIAPGKSAYMTPRLTARFEDFNRALATHFGTDQPSNISAQLINMSEGWSDDFLADPVHYNEAGAMFVAGRYFAAIEETLGR